MPLICPTDCGACCRFGAIVRFVLGNDWPLRDDGACGHLTADARCGIYGERPAPCRLTGDLEREADGCEHIQAKIGLPVVRPGIG